MPLNAQTDRDQILDNFLRLLDANELKQQTGSCFYRNEASEECYYCALGVLWIAAGGNFDEMERPIGDGILNKEPKSTFDRPYNLADELGLDHLSITDWNDGDRLKFPQIAERLRGRTTKMVDPQ